MLHIFFVLFCLKSVLENLDPDPASVNTDLKHWSWVRILKRIKTGYKGLYFFLKRITNFPQSFLNDILYGQLLQIFVCFFKFFSFHFTCLYLDLLKFFIPYVVSSVLDS